MVYFWGRIGLILRMCKIYYLRLLVNTHSEAFALRSLYVPTVEEELTLDHFTSIFQSWIMYSYFNWKITTCEFCIQILETTFCCWGQLFQIQSLSESWFALSLTRVTLTAVFVRLFCTVCLFLFYRVRVQRSYPVIRGFHQCDISLDVMPNKVDQHSSSAHLIFEEYVTRETPSVLVYNS